MGKPSQNYGVSPKYAVTQFYLQPDKRAHTALTQPPSPGWKVELTYVP